MKKIFDSILRLASVHVIRDYYEIRAMRSAMGINIAKYVSSSSKRSFSIISNEITKISKDVDLFYNGIKVDNEIQGSDLKIYINVFDGLRLFSVSNPMFSLSISVSEKINNTYSEIFSSVFCPIQNEMFYADKKEGVVFNGVKVKRNITQSRSGNLYACQNNSEILNNKNLMICENKNLGLCYLASGVFDSFIDFSSDNDHDMSAGRFICKLSGIELKEKFNQGKKITYFNI